MPLKSHLLLSITCCCCVMTCTSHFLVFFSCFCKLLTSYTENHSVHLFAIVLFYYEYYFWQRHMYALKKKTHKKPPPNNNNKLWKDNLSSFWSNSENINHKLPEHLNTETQRKQYKCIPFSEENYKCQKTFTVPFPFFCLEGKRKLLMSHETILLLFFISVVWAPQPSQL